MYIDVKEGKGKKLRSADFHLPPDSVICAQRKGEGTNDTGG